MVQFESQAVHDGFAGGEHLGALSLPPIHTGVSFSLPKFGIKLFDAINMTREDADHVYSRWSNPTLRVLEQRLAALEGAESGVVFASGMAAIAAILFTFLQQGDHVIASEVCYAGALELMGNHLPRFGVTVSLVDTCDPAAVAAAVRAETKVIYVETPANPILRLSDIRKMAQIAQDCGARLVVDSTFASPALQQPLQLGADLVVHSLTKYMNGHGDALGGVALGRRADMLKLRRDALVHLGGAMSPFNGYLIARGLETLSIRMERISRNALVLAEFLEQHPKVTRVYYPGLASHPQHDLAADQMADFGGMVTFRLKGGLGAAITLAEKPRLWQYATSLGHAESLLFYYPYDLYVDAMPYYTEENKRSIREWVGEGIVRASVGLENIDDLITDLDQALRGRTVKGWVGPLAYAALKNQKKETK